MNKNPRFEVEEKVVDFFKLASDQTKLRLFENLVFQLPYDTLIELYKAEVQEHVA